MGIHVSEVGETHPGTLKSAVYPYVHLRIDQNMTRIDQNMTVLTMFYTVWHCLALLALYGQSYPISQLWEQVYGTLRMRNMDPGHEAYGTLDTGTWS